MTPSTEIRTARIKLKLSVRDFGQLLGVSKRTVENWEQGRNAPRQGSLMLLRLMIGKRKKSKVAA